VSKRRGETRAQTRSRTSNSRSRTSRAHRAHRTSGTRRNGITQAREWFRTGPPPAQRARSIALIVVIGALIAAAIYVFTQAAIIFQVRRTQAHDETAYSFDPGMIVSDAKFFNSSALTEQQIQQFLDQQGRACTQSSCLKSASFSVRTVASDGLCHGYQPTSPQESAAHIINQTAHSCGISQKTLLVMLEKEQGLIRTSTPTPIRYRSAMGLSCPDTHACDTRYYGFFNQVYGAADRFKYYEAHPTQYRYKASKLNEISYNPNPACGTSSVYIENEATALLYIYTPYQPNKAALTGSPDICSSFGNLNFARLWKQWFGSSR
jgi:hypothetical protein